MKYKYIIVDLDGGEIYKTDNVPQFVKRSYGEFFIVRLQDFKMYNEATKKWDEMDEFNFTKEDFEPCS